MGQYKNDIQKLWGIPRAHDSEKFENWALIECGGARETKTGSKHTERKRKEKQRH